jgi:hypothetical protein
VRLAIQASKARRWKEEEPIDELRQRIFTTKQPPIVANPVTAIHHLHLADTPSQTIRDKNAIPSIVIRALKQDGRKDRAQP